MRVWFFLRHFRNDLVTIFYTAGISDPVTTVCGFWKLSEKQGYLGL